MRSIETMQTHTHYVRHLIVGMKSLFEPQRCFACVPAGEFQFEFGTESRSIHKPKVPRPPAAGWLVTLSEHGDGNADIIFHDGFQLPGFRAHESMGWSVGIIRFGAKPRKADRDSSSNRLTFLPSRFGAYKNDLIITRRFPGGHLGAVQVDFAVCAGSGDLASGEPAITFTNAGHTRNTEMALEFFGC